MIDKILLAKKYQIKEWLFAGYTALVLQDRLDLNQLLLTVDSLTVARLFSIRETMLRSRLATVTPLPRTPVSPTAGFGAFSHYQERPVPKPIEAPPTSGYRLNVACPSCRSTIEFTSLRESDIRDNVIREFAFETMTW